MTAEDLNSHLERGLFGLSSIKQLAGLWGALETPSDPDFQTGTNDSVTEQATDVDADWDEATKRLTIQARAGPGWWIPYIGNGAVQSRGVAATAGHGLGTYTPNVAAGAAAKSWVATGPFSGCHAVTFTTPDGGRVFAHIITSAEGHLADTAASQAEHIAGSVGAAEPTADELARSKVSGTSGFGFVFWTRLGAGWCRRVVFVNGDKVMNVGKRTAC